MAALERLRRPVQDGGFGYRASECEITYNGQPPPAMGQFFIAIHDGDWNTEGTENLEEVCGIDMTVTVKTGIAPRDRLNYVMVEKANNNLSQICRRLLRFHFDYWTMNRANELIQVEEQIIFQMDALGNVNKFPPPVNGFEEPLQFLSADRTLDQYLEWFSSPAPEDFEGIMPPMGLSRTMHFGKAKRLQKLEEAE